MSTILKIEIQLIKREKTCEENMQLVAENNSK
jgi:hypothetical protein